jgi:quercetin dioxygenase-like cupin family protein
LPKQRREPTYERFLREEGLPVLRGYGVPDVRTIELGPWQRLGGRGAYIQLAGMEGLTGMYVGEVPPGGALHPEKHLFDKLVYVLAGRGITEVWTPGAEGKKTFFEWQAGSLFAPPLNTYHRLLNSSGSEPARFLAVTSAPVVMDLYHNIPFVFGSDYVFDDRYNGQADYFTLEDRWYEDPAGEDAYTEGWVWETNFIRDVGSTGLDPREVKGAGSNITSYEMAGNVLVGHIAEWPVGKYHKAHYHGGGAILLIIQSRGYTLMWPSALGLHPYQSGHGDQVVKVDWQEGSVFSPPTGWFHQHFNTGPVPARQLALRYGSHKYAVTFWDIQDAQGLMVSTRRGGSLIDYEDEDPEVREQFREAVARAGVEYRMQDVFAPATA